MCMYKGIQLKYKLHHAGSWSAAADRASPPVLSPSSKYSSMTSASLSCHSRKEQFGMCLKMLLFQLFLTFFKTA